MDWRAEASALVEDMKFYVNRIGLSLTQESNDHRIYLEIVTLEGKELLVSMDASGFAICDNKSRPVISTEHNDKSVRVYETINSLLDDISPKFREAFLGDLHKRIFNLYNDKG